MIYDMHCHSTNSDGRQSVEEMCLSAIERGVTGFAVTDHADMNFYESRDTYNRICRSLEDIKRAREAYGDKLHLLRGVELGEYLYAPENADKVLGLNDFDVILGSVHLVPKARFDRPYNRIPFSEDGTDEEIREYLKLYFDLVSETVDAFDFDVLAHLTCPVRYITGVHQRPADAFEFEDKIREILEKVIKRNIALEYNTGGLNEKCHFCNVQNEQLFALYKSMGGKLVTVGSDAHYAIGIGKTFVTATTHLKELDFDSVCYYENRKPQMIKL